MDTDAFIKKIKITIENEPFMQDFRIFLSYVTENKIKLTPKGRWMPMKHLYAINSLLKEPLQLDDKLGDKIYKTREECYASRIYFIDLLAEASECIMPDCRDVLIKGREYARFIEMDGFRKKRWLTLAWYYHIDWNNWFPYGDFGRLLQTKTLEIIPYLKEWKETGHMVNFKTAADNLIAGLDLRWVAPSQIDAKEHMNWGIAQCLLQPLIYLNIISIPYEKEGKHGFKDIKGFYIQPLGKIFLDELIKIGERLKDAEAREQGLPIEKTIERL